MISQIIGKGIMNNVVKLSRGATKGVNINISNKIIQGVIRMRKVHIVSVTLFVVFAFLISGCSSGKSNPMAVQPDSSTDSPILLPGTNAGNSNRNLLGTWTFQFNPETLTATIEPNREVNRHYSVGSSIEPPTIVVTYWDPVTETVHVSVTIKNSSYMSVFDVRLIIYTDDVGHILSNADDWTGLWDIAEGLPINPFMAYAKTATRRNFQAQASYTENLHIYCPESNYDIQFAIDASFPGNCEEPYEISNFTQGVLYNSTGASTDVEVTVHDWQEDVSEVYIYYPDITGVPLLPFTQIEPEIWECELINETGASEGNYQGYIIASSTDSGLINLYEKINISVSNYVNHGWAHSWGGYENDSGKAVVVDDEGNIYISGYFTSDYHRRVDFDPGPEEENHHSGYYCWSPPSGCGYVPSGYICKYDRYGTFKWVHTWGKFCLSSEIGNSITLDSVGNVYVCGVDFDQAFINKYNTTGDWIWSNKWGDDNNPSSAWSITSDNIGNIICVGNFRGTVDFDPGPGVMEYTSNGRLDIYISKFDTTGNIQWTVVNGTSKDDSARAVAVDSSANIYIAGYYWNYLDDSKDIYFSKGNPSGNFIWTKTFNKPYENNDDMASDITIDNKNNIYLTGFFSDTIDFDPGPQVDEHTSSYADSSFLLKFDTSGNYIWGLSWNAWCGWMPFGDSAVCTNSTGDVFVSGYFREVVDFNPGAGIDERTPIGWADMYLSKFDDNGEYIWCRTWGVVGGGDCEKAIMSGIVCDNSDNILTTGSLSDTIDLDPGPNEDFHEPARTQNASSSYLMKILPNGYWE
jgi:hypothetical protein